MKVLITSYNTVCQNPSGGVQVRIKNYTRHICKFVDAKCFDVWNDCLDDYDILHVFKATIDSYALMCKAKEKGMKIVLSSVIPQEKKFNILYNLIANDLFRVQNGYSIIKKELLMSDRIIAQTQQEKDFIVRCYGISERKITVLPNGISISFKDENRTLLSSKYGVTGKYILQVGRFDENKNQLSLIRALKGHGIPIVFIGGEDPKYKEYYRICQSEGDAFCLFLGWQENGSPLMQSAYMNADVVVLPSKKEIFGNSLIEGGAAGAKLAATKSLPINDLGISDYCTSFDPLDVDDIRNVLIPLFEEEKKIGQSQFFFDKFSWNSVAEKHFGIYKSLME